MIAVEAGGDALIERGIGQQIAGQLLDGEAVERQIAVEGVDHPIAPAPHVARPVGLVAVGVAVARRFHPAEGHALAIARRRQQTIDHLAVGVGRSILKKRVDLRGRGRKAGQVQAHAAQQRRLVGLGGGVKSLAFEPGENEAVDGIAHPLLVANRGIWRPPGRDERPEGLPAGPLRDPAANPFDFGGLQRGASGIGRRHADRGVRGSHAPDEFAPLRIARHDGEAALGEFDPGAGFGVEAQFGLPLGGIRTVAGKALIGENRADIAIEFDLLAAERSRGKAHEYANRNGRFPKTHVRFPSASGAITFYMIPG